MFADTLVDLKIEIWHHGEHEQSLREYLGWTTKQYETFVTKGKTPWIENVYGLNAIGDPETIEIKKAIDIVFNKMIALRDTKNFREIDLVLNSLATDRLDDELLISFLMSTYSVRAELTSFNSFFYRVKDVIASRTDDEGRIKKLLEGFDD